MNAPGPPILPLLLLTTTGRRSGRARATPLLYLADGAGLVVVGSNWGQAHHPAWSSNLLAQPRATVEIGGRRRAVLASRATEPNAGDCGHDCWRCTPIPDLRRP